MITRQKSVKITDVNNRVYGPANNILPQDVLFGIWDVENCKFEYRSNIPLSSIYIPPMIENPARYHKKDQENIDGLAKDFDENGISYADAPPILEEIKGGLVVDGVTYEYRLVCGAHRVDAMIKNGYTEWVFDVYSFHGQDPKAAMTSLQFAENNHKVRLPSRPVDIQGGLKVLIADKSIENTESAIRNWITKHCTNLKPGAVGNIVGSVIRANGTWQDEVKYTAGDAQKWVETYTDRTIRGNLDKSRDQHGWAMKEGYEDEYTYSIINKFGETGKESYIMGHTNGSTETNSLAWKRINQKMKFDKFEANLLKVMDFYQKFKRFPWHINLWFGQDRKNGETNELITLEQVKKTYNEEKKAAKQHLDSKLGLNPA